MKHQTLLLVLATFSNAFAGDYQAQDLGQFLKEFHSETPRVMGQLPPKTDHNLGQNPFKGTTRDRSIEARDIMRQKFCKVVDGTEQCLYTPEGRAAIMDNDNPFDLIDTGREICGAISDVSVRTSCFEKSRPVKTLSEIDAQKLQQFSLKTRPWSDDYWPIARGVLGHRYADPDKSSSLDWKEAYDWMIGNPRTTYVEQNRLELLSPSEKYDLLVGDLQGTLTKSMWQEGKAYYEQSGKVEPWMGICHGWAGAAYMLPRPQKAITVLAADGVTKISFYPADIKALGSLLWAKNEAPTKFIGGRCDTKDPKKDQNGRIIDQDCFDTNPASWHLTVVNQIAKARRSFVLDATFDYEVWNQPVVGYNLRYFNPETGTTSLTAAESAIALADYKRDPFARYRDRQSTRVVGVEMRVEYVVETAPQAISYDDESLDMTTTATYRYDLELDNRGNLIGGEWYSQAHPDFLWTPNRSSKIRNQVDDYLLEQNPGTRWKDGTAVPYAWRKGAAYASRYGSPLALIVERLFEMSQK